MYAAIYYQTIRDTGIDPVTCGGISEVGPERVEEPVQLAGKALAKATKGSVARPRKRAGKKAVPVSAV